MDRPPDTAVTAAALRELHRIHRQLSDLRERIERGPKQIKAREANVVRLEGEWANSKTDVKNAKVAADQKQLSLKAGEARIQDLRSKLNQASSNREYQALKDQTAADEMANSVLADEILEALEKIDGLAGLVVEAERNLAKAKEELTRAQAQWNENQGRLEGDLKRLEAQLREAETVLPRDFDDAYKRIVKSKGSDAMAQIEEGNCGGCFQNITPNMLNSLMLSKVVCCQNCGRLLYMPEDRSPGAG